MMRFKLVVSRRSTCGLEILFLRCGDTWTLPTGESRLAESPQRSAERCLTEGLGLNLAVFEADRCGDNDLVFVAEAPEDGDELLALDAAEYEWFGLGKIRAMTLEGRDACFESLVLGLE